MPNKRFSDVSPEFGDKDSSKESLRGTPAKSGAGPFKAAGGKPNPTAMKGKGGKDLPAIKLDEYSNRADEACGELPKGI